jgi:hypothetical protein
MEKIKTKAIEKKSAPKEKNKKVVKKTTKKIVKKVDAVKIKTAPEIKINKVATIKKKNIFWQSKKVPFSMSIFLIISMIIFAVLLHQLNYDEKGPVNKGVSLADTVSAEGNLDSVKAAVVRNFKLVYDEDPVLATVSDIEKMRAQNFFIEILNNDKVLIYTKNKKIILFRPSTNKIIDISEDLGINVSAVNQEITMPKPNSSTNANQSKIANNGEKTVSAKIIVANGARIGGLAQKIGEKITSLLGISIAEKTNALGKYKDTLVVDLSGKNSVLAQRIAGAIGGRVAGLPAGEVAPVADILVIGGSDFNN